MPNKVSSEVIMPKCKHEFSYQASIDKYKAIGDFFVIRSNVTIYGECEHCGMETNEIATAGYVYADMIGGDDN